MEIKYNVTGAKRKELVAAISKITGCASVYKKTPTFAFEVADYYIDKNGTLTGSDSRELTAELVKTYGFVAVSEKYDSEAPDIDQHHPGQYADPNTPVTEEMMEQAEAWMEGQPDSEDLRLSEHEELGLGRERRESFQGENGMQASDVPQELGEDYNKIRTADIPHGTDSLAIEMPKDGFTETAMVNLRKLIESKAALIKKALGADCLPVEEIEDRLRFPWFTFSASTEEVSAYTRFISALCTMAKEQQRITAKEKPVDNEKYAFRCFLLRLGFIGSEYKTERKILLQNLTGNTAFKSGRPHNEADEQAMEAGASRVVIEYPADRKVMA